MFCGECGTENPETNSFCKNCGKALNKSPAAAGVSVPTPVTPAAAMAVPGYTAPETVPAQPSSAGAARPARNWLAIISILASLAAWLVYPIILGFLAIVLGAAALYTAKKKKAKIPVTAILAIVIGVLAIVINFFWLDIFPAPVVLPPIK